MFPLAKTGTDKHNGTNHPPLYFLHDTYSVFQEKLDSLLKFSRSSRAYKAIFLLLNFNVRGEVVGIESLHCKRNYECEIYVVGSAAQKFTRQRALADMLDREMPCGGANIVSHGKTFRHVSRFPQKESQEPAGSRAGCIDFTGKAQDSGSRQWRSGVPDAGWPLGAGRMPR